VPEVLRLLGVVLAPQSDLGLHGCAFGRGVRFPICRTLFVLILFIVPSHARLHLIEASILTFNRTILQISGP
jgi:hypothetical protein